MARKRKHYSEPPQHMYDLQRKSFELSKLSFDERKQLAILCRQNQKDGPVRETVELVTGQKVDIFGAREISVLV